MITEARAQIGSGRTLDIALHQAALDPLSHLQADKNEGGIRVDVCAAPKRASFESKLRRRVRTVLVSMLVEDRFGL